MTIYANVVNVRGSGRQIVLEFGSFFPEGDQLPPKGHPPDVKVVLAEELLGPLVDILQQRLRTTAPSIREQVN